MSYQRYVRKPIGVEAIRCDEPIDVLIAFGAGYVWQEEHGKARNELTYRSVSGGSIPYSFRVGPEWMLVRETVARELVDPTDVPSPEGPVYDITLWPTEQFNHQHGTPLVPGTENVVA